MTINNIRLEKFPEKTETSALSDQVFLSDLRSQMLKFAMLQLSNKHLAEDVVQEALIGAYKNKDSFLGGAALKTWIFAILKNKIADILRQKQHLIEASSFVRQMDTEADFSEPFGYKEFWDEDLCPEPWCDPQESLRQSQFLAVFSTCLQGLPVEQARAFMMREFVELESHEICDTLGITPSNLNVMLHRARLRLRVCLDKHWFCQEES